MPLHYRKPNRLKNFDYSSHKYYFITICTNGKKKYFGDIHKNTMCINKLGAIVYRQWEWLAKQYSYIELHAFILMPNHVHGIIEIIPERVEKRVVTGLDLSLPDQPQKILSLSHLVGAFKTTSSKLIHQTGFTQFGWQRSFYDHIIHTPETYNKIYHYIIDNPILWDRDRNNPNLI